MGVMNTPDFPRGAAEVARFRAALLDFFDDRGRDLPWRRTSDPYLILVSEIMLQQTRVETVVPYYRKWIERFPDAATLAAADTEEVLRYWQGLGYYRRARNLQLAAREVEAEWGGALPGDAKALGTLPGVGPYTAGAVASIAFGEAVPAVDGNVRRVMARLLDDPAPGAALLAREVGALVPPERPGDFNQALMELGATVCTPRSPRCDRCPVAEWCAARAAGTQESRPRPPARKTVPRMVEAVAVVVRPGDSGWEVLLRRRPDDGLLGGMWECPGVEVGSGGAPHPAGEGGFREAARALAGRLCPGAGGMPTLDEVLPAVDHVFTHLRVTYRPVRFRRPAGTDILSPGQELPPPLRWVAFGVLGELPIPRAQQRILGGAEPEAVA
ncbi:MAG: A/G-specific adenine glycosylase [Gemmatimonadales bacterium]|nr:MAG: A/G-specific adenine glycosylase [Gemmatimonadales bacterium]